MRSRRGVTLVELSVIIGVITLLLALSLPALQNAREAARRAHCRNNLRQLALASLHHETAHGRLPTNGWGYRWVGDPDRGTDRNQPGGWAYNLLAYVEQQTLRERGRGEPSPRQRVSLTELTRTPLAIFRCPSRPGRPLEPTGDFPENHPYNALHTPDVAKTDYACCEGDYVLDSRGGPRGYEDARTYANWRDGSKATGVCFERSEVRLSQIEDGTSNTYLVGEKYVSRRGYGTAEDTAHDQSLYGGADWDLARWVIGPPLPDADEFNRRAFGSAHAGASHMALCDGSVRPVSYSIDPETHRRLGNRRDGAIVDHP